MRTDLLTFVNNIISVDEAAAQNLAVTAAVPVGVALTIDGNLYDPNTIASNRLNWLGTAKTFAVWRTDSGKDASSPTPADPLFTDPAGGDFILQAGSPAIGAGLGGATCGYIGP